MRHPEFRKSCTLRVFAAVATADLVSGEVERITSLLVKFRIEAEVIVVHTNFVVSEKTAARFTKMTNCEQVRKLEVRWCCLLF